MIFSLLNDKGDALTKRKGPTQAPDSGLNQHSLYVTEHSNSMREAREAMNISLGSIEKKDSQLRQETQDIIDNGNPLKAEQLEISDLKS